MGYSIGQIQAMEGIPLSLQEGQRYNKLCKRVQEKLKEKGYILTPDGMFGRNTRLAVEDFQLEMNLDVTGSVDVETLKSLYTYDKKMTEWETALGKESIKRLFEKGYLDSPDSWLVKDLKNDKIPLC